MLLDHVLMWILEGSHQLDLAAEKEKVDGIILRSTVQTWGGGGSADGGGTGLGGAGT